MNVNELCNAVMQLDLDLIKTKLMHVESGEGWSLEKVNAVEKEYRRFLCLMKLYPEEDTAPLVDVDTFWHYHILDTMKYAADCQQAFGYFLHHYPYVGLRGGDDEQFRLDSGNRMGELYEATFGEPYPGTPQQAGATAYCAGPWDDRIKAATAYCAGPWDDRIKTATAYCAGPWGDKLKAATAYCAGPWDDKIKTATAYCAGPWDQKAAAADKGMKAATAYCAGPWNKKNSAATLDTATAYCAGPWDKPLAAATDGIGMATAYCAGPWNRQNGAAAAVRPAQTA
jgi:hypothetical protein